MGSSIDRNGLEGCGPNVILCCTTLILAPYLTDTGTRILASQEKKTFTGRVCYSFVEAVSVPNGQVTSAGNVNDI